MKLWGESRICLETHEPMAIISTRTTITFGICNVRTMFEAGKTTHKLRRNEELQSVIGISETRWTGHGPRRTQRGNGVQWTPWTYLDDLHFADDLALLSHTQRQMQEKTNTVRIISARLGLRVHKVLENNAAVSKTPKTLGGDGLEDVTSFTYSGSIVDKQTGVDADVEVRTGRARAAFLQMKNIWPQIS